MNATSRNIAVVSIALLSFPFGSLRAQVTDTTRRDSTFDIRSILGEHEDRGGFTITSGKAYNRVEGFPVMLGPAFRGYAHGAALRLTVLGILRTAHSVHWDSENIGHHVVAEARFGAHRGYSIGATSFDVVSPVERWQMPEPDAGLSAFLFKKDYLDYYGRHGARLFASAFAGDVARVEVQYGNERWSSRRARDVVTLFRGSHAWPINPQMDDGTMHLFQTHLALDSRNAVPNPWAGWYVDAAYEYGTGSLSRSLFETPTPSTLNPTRVDYGRLFFDVRKYNRISPETQLNARLVIGGWLHGDPLPLERRFSVGGPGTLPGFDFRRIGIGTDVGQCAPDDASPPGRPAMCERVALAQLEYRNELHSDLIDVFNRNGLRLRGAEFTVRPSIVAFVDAGRGWLVGTREGKLRYPSTSLPPFGTYRTDVGLGIDLGVAGIYVAKAVSSSKEPANVFIRIHNRF